MYIYLLSVSNSDRGENLQFGEVDFYFGHGDIIIYVYMLLQQKLLT